MLFHSLQGAGGFAASSAVVPEYISKSANSAASGTTLTISTPAGAVSGDLLVFVAVGNAAANWTAPSGFTTSASDGRFRAYTYYNGSDSSFTFTTSTSAILVGVMLCIRNAVFDVDGANSATATNPIAPSINVTTNNSILFGCASVTNLNGTSYSAPSGWTTVMQAYTDTTSGSLAVFKKDSFQPAGATGTVGISRAIGSATNSRAFLFSVKPAKKYSAFLQYIDNTLGQSSYTFSGPNLGAATDDRHIVVCAFGSAAANHSISSITLGGTAMTNVVSINTVQTPISIRILKLTTGTTANVVVNFSAATTRCGIAVFSLTGYGNVTSYDTATAASAGTTLSATIDSVADGIVLGMSSQISGNPPNTVSATAGFTATDFSGVTDTTSRVFVGSTFPATTATNDTYTITYSGTSTQDAQLAIASFT